MGLSSSYCGSQGAGTPRSLWRQGRTHFTFVTGAKPGVNITSPAAGVVLYPNRPNPVRSSTRIPFAIGADSPAGTARVTLRIFDASGRLVRTLLEAEAEKTPTVRLPIWDGRDEKGHRVGPGIYR